MRTEAQLCLLFSLCIVTHVIVAVSNSSTTPVSTTLSPDLQCLSHQDCGSCVAIPMCLWCESNPEEKRCIHYPKSALPDKDVCPLENARWGTCWLNYKALIISVSVILGVVLLTITTCCIYCCCCRRRANHRRRMEEENARMDRITAEREAKSMERRAERQSKYDEIRQKYGLSKDNSYQRFENE